LQHGDHLAVWFDTTQKFSLVHEHPDYTSGSRGPHTRGHLTDYTKMLRWSWDYDDKQHKVYNCYLEKNTEEQKAPCISTGADKRGSFTIGETFAVDAYVATYKSNTTESEHETIVQSGSTSKVVEQVSRGKVRREDTESFFMDRMSFYDLNEVCALVLCKTLQPALFFPRPPLTQRSSLFLPSAPPVKRHVVHKSFMHALSQLLYVIQSASNCAVLFVA
jgi:hypothetical protein